MKLGNLSAVGRTPENEQIMITLPTDLIEKLKPYTDKQERSGFLREAGRLMLALTDQYDLGETADNIVISCETMADLDNFTKNLYRLGRELIDRAGACETEGENG